MKRTIVLLLIILLFSLVFAVDCDTTLDKLERTDISYTVLPNGNADMTVVLVADYSKECLLQRFVDNTDQNLESYEITISSEELECPSEFLENYIDEELGNFDSPLTCVTTFVGDENHIRMNFTGTAIDLAKQVDAKYVLNIGGGYFFSNLPNDSSLTINVPADATILNHLPKEGEKTEARIYWYPIPAKMVQIEFSLPNTTAVDQTDNQLIELLPIIIGAFIGLIVMVMLILAKMMRTNTAPVSKEPKKDIEADAKLLKEKMRSLENSYMKGSLDETTYRRLMEQYQLQLNDLRVQLRKQKK